MYHGIYLKTKNVDVIRLHEIYGIITTANNISSICARDAGSPIKSIKIVAIDATLIEYE
jgi:selenophosphate synthase